jgi:hypothetical protein
MFRNLLKFALFVEIDTNHASSFELAVIALQVLIETNPDYRDIL